MAIEAPIRPGDDLLGKYRVERIVGHGGMGWVVAARHIDLDELFAIKLMMPAFVDTPEALDRFLREARAAAKLKGEHVAKVHDVGRLPDGMPYMVLEYLEGCDLRALVKHRGPLPIHEAIDYVLQACETLREAHSLGIVHRDVKPANMFLTHRPNGTTCIKVIDFGISKYNPTDAVALTATGASGGSPLYMSPEHMRSAKHVDGRTDIWSVGVMLYELLTATTPFHADTITAVAGRVLQDEPEPPSRVRPEVQPALDAIVLRCLAKRLEDRFQSMDELMVALRQLLSANHEASALAPPARASLPSAPAARAMSAGTTTATFGQSRHARPSDGRRGLPLWAGVVTIAVVTASVTGWMVFSKPRSSAVSAGSPSPSISEKAASSTSDSTSTTDSPSAPLAVEPLPAAEPAGTALPGSRATSSAVVSSPAPVIAPASKAARNAATTPAPQNSSTAGGKKRTIH